MHRMGNSRQEILVDQARRQLVSHQYHKTLKLQEIAIDVAWGKSSRALVLIDSVGIAEGIHEQAEIRQAMAATLEQLGRSHMILHMMDAASVSAGQVESLGPVDEEISQYAALVNPYVILANKMDKPGASEGLAAIKDRFRGIPVIAISALNRRGFKEVKAFVFRHLA
ncbi:MAG: 50S ribosome-binding GTPase [Firmicutes bacterium]|nr:50S ribosome-binding GTPase [Bacillota bacterium]